MVIAGLIIGFLQALVPEGMKLWQDKRDKAHELKVMELQMQQAAAGRADHLEEIRVSAQAEESRALQKSYQLELKYSGKYAASVRPTITYVAMAVYAIQKVLLILNVLYFPLPWLQDAGLAQVATVLWTEFDQTLLSWIMGFWFGSRQIKK